MTFHRLLRILLCALGLIVATMPAARGLYAQATGPAYAQLNPQEDQGEITKAPPGTLIRFDVIAGDIDYRIDSLLEQMSLEEKVGQLIQIYPNEEKLTEETAEKIRQGRLGSLFYPGNASVVEEAQRIAVEETRLGIPLLIARDVVHGFRTVFPIPLGQAASWNPELVQRAASVAARESRLEGIDWTFAPMMDVCRDPRWGRIAETFGEDPFLSSELAAATVRGFQQDRDGKVNGILACAKHYVGYGLSEGGRDYNRVSVSQADLHNVLLPPFRTSVNAGCRTVMTTFSEVNGVPGTAHKPLLQGVLRRDMRFDGFVVSDWGSITEMVVHGYAKDNEQAALLALLAGVDMDMCSTAYAGSLKKLIAAGKAPESIVDDAVRRVLKCKAELVPRNLPIAGTWDRREGDLATARELARQSVVLLKNEQLLPMDASQLARIAVIGPMADAPKQQLGCWTLDGRAEESITPLADLRRRMKGQAEVTYAPGAVNTFSQDNSLLAAAVEAAQRADVALLYLGEDATLSGEARSRADLSLPGVQTRLLNAVAETGTPVVIVFLAGRPLTIETECELAQAVMYGWHPGSMAGPAINDLLLGVESPSGKLPSTFPKSVGQIPLYYNHSNTGRPSPEKYQPLFGSKQDDLAPEFQYRSHYLDIDPYPLFPFGFGLSYSTFAYSNLEVSSPQLRLSGLLSVRVKLENTGQQIATEVSQLYTRDRTGGIVRPVRQLKAYRRTELSPGESTVLEFSLPASQLGYFNNSGDYILEPGEFDVWVGGDSLTQLGTTFELVADLDGKEKPSQARSGKPAAPDKNKASAG